MAATASTAQRQFQGAMKRLSRKHRQLLLSAMGNPPMVDNIPAAVWKQINDENAELLILLVAAAAMSTLSTELRNLNRAGGGLDGVSPSDWKDLIQQQAEARARQAADWTTETTRKRLAAREESNDAATADDVADVLSDKRIEDIVRNEETAGRSAGRIIFRDTADENGIDVCHIWQLGPCQHCKVCPILHGTTDRFWRQFTAGPPLHPHCCCTLQTLYMTPSEAIAQGLARRPPSGSALQKAIQDSGFSKFLS